MFTAITVTRTFLRALVATGVPAEPGRSSASASRAAEPPPRPRLPGGGGAAGRS